MTLDRAYLDAMAAWGGQQADDPCAARDHGCRCQRPELEALIGQQRAEQHDREERFRALFTPARRERLAELDALTDQIEPLLDRLDHAWRAVETDLGWNSRRRAAAPAGRSPVPSPHAMINNGRRIRRAETHG